MSKNFLIKCFKSWFELKIPFASENTKLKEELLKYNIKIEANGEIILPSTRYTYREVGPLVIFCHDRKSFLSINRSDKTFSLIR